MHDITLDVDAGVATARFVVDRVDLGLQTLTSDQVGGNTDRFDPPPISRWSSTVSLELGSGDERDAEKAVAHPANVHQPGLWRCTR